MKNIKQQFNDKKFWFAIALGFGLGLVIFFVSLWLLLSIIMETDIITNIFHSPELFFVILALASGALGGLLANIFFPKKYYAIIASSLLVLIFAYFDILRAFILNLFF